MTPGIDATARPALALVVIGLALMILSGWLMGRLDWRPLVLPLDVDTAREQRAGFTTASAGWYELQLEVSRSAPPDAVQAAIEVVDRPSPVDLRWRVERGGDVIAAGDARDYMFLDPGPHGLPGRMRRVLMRVPTGVDRAFLLSGGLMGNTTAARGVGRFQAETDGAYELVVAANDGLTGLAAGEPRMVVSIARQTSQRHYRRVSPIGYAGLVTLGAGLLLGLWRLVAGFRR